MARMDIDVFSGGDGGFAGSDRSMTTLTGWPRTQGEGPTSTRLSLAVMKQREHGNDDRYG